NQPCQTQTKNYHTYPGRADFLRLNRAVIIDALPFSEDWCGLDGALSRRFLWEGASDSLSTGSGVSVIFLAQVLVVVALDSLSTGSRVSAIFLDPIFATREFGTCQPTLRHFWNEVIGDRKRLELKNTLDTESLEMLSE
ncbi:2582_t:CDS:2, partial [Acaulospora morrowiae]